MLKAVHIVSSSGHEVTLINALFRPHDSIRLVVSLTIVQFSSSYSSSSLFNGRPGLLSTGR